MTQINACCLLPRLAAKHYLKKKKRGKKERKENLQMTALFRQGVESVCKGKGERLRTGPSCRRKPSWGEGGEGAAHGLRGGTEGEAGSELWRALRAGGWCHHHFSFKYPNPLLPPGG